MTVEWTLPFLLAIASIATCTAAMAAYSLASRRTCSERWGDGLLLVAVILLVVAFGVGVSS